LHRRLKGLFRIRKSTLANTAGFHVFTESASYLEREPQRSQVDWSRPAKRKKQGLD
jgi:hypothetical protein